MIGALLLGAVALAALLGLLYADVLAEVKMQRERIQSLETSNRRLISQLSHRRPRSSAVGRVIS